MRPSSVMIRPISAVARRWATLPTHNRHLLLSARRCLEQRLRSSSSVANASSSVSYWSPHASPVADTAPSEPPAPAASLASVSPSSASAPSTEDEARLRSLNQEVSAMFVAGDYEAALPVAASASALALSLFSSSHPAYASAVNNEALLHKHCRRYSSATALYQQSLLSYQQALGPSHPSALTAANNLALLYKQTGEWEKAHDLFTSVLAGRRAALGAAHQLTAATMHNLALLLSHSEQHSAAISMAQQAVQTMRQRYGSESEESAAAMNNLAFILKSSGDHTVAMQWYDRALAVRGRLLPFAHPDLIISMHNVAECWRAMRKEERAQEVQQTILQMIDEADRRKKNKEGKLPHTADDQHKHHHHHHHQQQQSTASTEGSALSGG